MLPPIYNLKYENFDIHTPAFRTLRGVEAL
jgi:hypothetical protein